MSAKKIGRPFQKGKSGNPSGRPKLPDDIKAARRMNQHELERLLNRIFHMTSEELKTLINAPETAAFERLIGTIMWKGITFGDHGRCNFLLDRLIGKVMEKVKVDLPIPTVIKLKDGESLVLGARHEETEE